MLIASRFNSSIREPTEVLLCSGGDYMLGIPDIALGAICAALIAAGVSLLSLIISKENKTSEFRQAWIDALRSETTSLVSELRLVSRRKAGLSPELEGAGSLLKVRAGQTGIRLRLRPDDFGTGAVIDALDEIDGLIARGNWNEASVDAAARKLENAVQPVLRANWLVVKRGEPWFRASGAIALLTIGTALALLLGPSAVRLLDAVPTVSDQTAEKREP